MSKRGRDLCPARRVTGAAIELTDGALVIETPEGVRVPCSWELALLDEL